MTASVIYVAYATTSIDLTWIPQDIDVVVVVNGGGRPTIDPDRSITWIEPKTNLGFGAAINLAASGLRTERIVMVNPDCSLTTVHWSALSAARPGAIVTIPLDSDGVPTIVASRYPTPISLVAGAFRLRGLLRRSTSDRVGSRLPGGLSRGQVASLGTYWVSGACASVDRERFLAVGGFSPDYFLYYEDVDLCRRLAVRFPDMSAEVANVPPGQHSVAASAAASRGRATAARARSAAVYASTRQGISWQVAAIVADWNARRSERAALPPEEPPVDVVVVSLGRKTSRGERRRAHSWIEIAATAGRSAAELCLLEEASRPGPIEALRKTVAVLRGRLVPEVLAWSTDRAAIRLASRNPSLVVILTSRAYDARLVRDDRHLILDYIDRLSDSYRDRADLPDTRRRARLAWRTLARAHQRFEQHRPAADLCVAAGLGDAQLLNVTYVPITTQAQEPDPSDARSHDLAFVGNLRFPPNIEAVRELAALWPSLVHRRPGTRFLLAGADPAPEVYALAGAHDWSLLADFADVRMVYASTRLAVAPLSHASGIQTKVIDALSNAVPVIAYPAAAKGFDASVPIVVVRDAASLVERVVELLDDEPSRIALSQASTDWVRLNLDPSAWAWVVEAGSGHR